MDPVTLSVGLRIFNAAADHFLDGAKRRSNAESMAREAHEAVRELLRINDSDLRTKSAQACLPLVRDALTLVKREIEKDLRLRGRVLLDLAATYETLGESQLSQDHLNDACDCIVILLERESEPERRRALIKERDEIYPLIKERRMRLTT